MLNNAFAYSSSMCRSPERTRLTTLIQIDLAGMLPQTLVELALPSSQLTFFLSLKQALKDAGHWKTDS